MADVETCWNEAVKVEASSLKLSAIHASSDEVPLEHISRQTLVFYYFLFIFYKMIVLVVNVRLGNRQGSNPRQNAKTQLISTTVEMTTCKIQD